MCKNKSNKDELVISKLARLALKTIEESTVAQRINFFGGVITAAIVAGLVVESEIKRAVTDAINTFANTPNSTSQYLPFMYIALIMIYFFVCAKFVDKKTT